jgi:hypothetical protein
MADAGIDDIDASVASVDSSWRAVLIATKVRLAFS